MVSAIKVDGRKLYELARAGETVERPARHVRIDAFVVEEFVGGAYPEATIRVDCSSGTYVRTLAADLGTALGGCAHLGELRRLRVGSFGLDEAHTLDEIAADPEACVLTPAAALRDLTEVVVDGEQQRAVAHGATFAAPALLGDLDDAPGPFAVVDEHGELLAVYERRGARREADRRARAAGVVMIIWRDPGRGRAARRRAAAARSRSARSTVCTSATRPCSALVHDLARARGPDARPCSPSTVIRPRSCGPARRRSCSRRSTRSSSCSRRPARSTSASCSRSTRRAARSPPKTS